MLEFLRSDSHAWGEAVAIAAILLIWGLLVWLMWRGYRNRQARDAALVGQAEQAQRPAREPDAEVVYTGTTFAGSQTDRAGAAGLFGRGPCALWLDADGLTFARHRAPVLRIAQVNEVALLGAHAGRVLGAGRICVVRWTASGGELDTGFGFGTAAEAEAFADAVLRRKAADVLTPTPDPQKGGTG